MFVFYFFENLTPILMLFTANTLICLLMLKFCTLDSTVLGLMMPLQFYDGIFHSPGLEKKTIDELLSEVRTSLTSVFIKCFKNWSSHGTEESSGISHLL